MNYLEVSAKTGKGVGDAFSQMGLKVYSIMKNKEAPVANRHNQGQSIKIPANGHKPKTKKDKNGKKRKCLVM